MKDASREKWDLLRFALVAVGAIIVVEALVLIAINVVAS